MTSTITLYQNTYGLAGFPENLSVHGLTNPENLG